MKPLLVLLLAATIAAPLSAQPQPLPEGPFRITESVAGLAANHRYDLRLASSGERFLAGWIDERAGQEAGRLIVMPVDAAGNPLSTYGFALGEPANVAGFAIAGDGTDFMVVWQPLDGPLRTARINVDSSSVVRETTVSEIDGASDLALTRVDAGFVLTYRAPGADNELYAALLDDEGNYDGGRAIVDAGAPIEAVRVAPREGVNAFMVVWTAGGKTYAAPVERNSLGFTTAQPGAPIAGQGVVTAIATSGGTYMAVLSTPVEQRRELTTIVFDAAGTITRGAEPAGEAAGVEQHAAVTWTGSRFELLAIANDARSARMTSFNAAGELLTYPRTLVNGEIYGVAAESVPGATIIVYNWRAAGSGASLQIVAKNVAGFANEKYLSISEPETAMPSVVWRGDHYLSVWVDRRGDRRDLVHMRVNPDGTRGTPVLRAGGATGSDHIAVDTDGTNALLAWHGSSGTEHFVRLLLVRSADGSNDETAVTIATSGLQSEPSVRWNGTEYLVAWASHDRVVYAMRIAADGTPIDVEPVEIAPELATSRPAIAWNGTHWIVAYVAAVPRDPDAEYLEFDLYVHAVQLTRELVRSGAPMRLSGTEPTTPHVASRGNEVLVVWGTTVPSNATYGARIVNGANVDPAGGFHIGEGVPSALHATATGYVVLEQGGRGWSVRGRAASHLQALFPFVPALAQTDVVYGGPNPLVVYRVWPAGSEQVPQVRARYVLEQARTRAVRK